MDGIRDSKTVKIGNKLYGANALKYRGYYYDADLGMYYLGSRFYDSEICRFVNADTEAVVLASQLTLTDKNLYAYRDNNPVMRKDAEGEFWDTVLDVLSLGASIVEVAVNPTDPWAWAGLVGDTIDLIPFVTGVGEVTKSVKVTINVTETSGDAIKSARAVYNSSGSANRIRKMTGSYDIEFASGTHYVGKGNFQRAITSAKNKSNKYSDAVKTITWKSADNNKAAFLDEFYMQSKYGGRKRDGAPVYNEIWSPGRRYSGF